MDRLTPEARSRLMARIRGDNLGPESAVKAALRKAGIRFTPNCPQLPGKPDIYIDSARLAVFVHGCFWHACRRHYRRPKTNRRFWAAKVAGNVRRDARAARRLRRSGVAVATVWECRIRANLGGIVGSLLRKVAKRPLSTTPASVHPVRSPLTTLL